MNSNCECVIVGGGIIGCSVGYHLSLLGMSDLVLLEREDFLGTRSTAKSAGGVRQQFTTPINIRLSRLSVERFHRLHAELEVEFEFHQHGYLFLATSEDQRRRYEAQVALQRSLGVPVDLLEREEIARRWPFLVTDDVHGGTFCAEDGFTEPHEFTQGFAKQIRKRGGRIRCQAGVIRLSHSAGVWRIDLQGERYETPRVVLTAGVWSKACADMIGLELPIRPIRRQIVLTRPLPAVPDRVPLTIDGSNGWYFRKETGGILMGAINPDEPSSFMETVDDEWNYAIMERGLARMPALEQAQIQRCWAGLYCVTPDHHPVLGAVEGFDGLYVATGFSGHGIMHSPAAGLLVAETIVHGKARTLDIDCLNLSRFARGALLEETNVI